jgi:hypothetical protein
MGPGATAADQIPRPPADGESLEEVMNPPKPKEGETPRDPQAGPKVRTPEEEQARLSKLANESADLEASRLRGMERERIRMEESARLAQEERDKEVAKMREEVKKETAKPQPVGAQAGPGR